MRQIKFRAWDSKREIMIGSDYPSNWGDEKDEWWADTSYMNLIGIEDISKDKRFEVMQFTGLLDRNGKEIYEGDIVKWSGDSDISNSFYITPNGIYEVIWKWTGFHFRDSQNCKFVPKPGEIIGNIYENPELLK